MFPTRLQWNRSPTISFEWPLPVLTLLLVGVGLALIYSAVAPMGDAGRFILIKQMTWCSLGLVIMTASLLFDYRLLDRWGVWFFIAVIGALILVWAVGKVTAGSKRWIEIGFMRLQPSEFAKLAVVFVLAKYYQSRSGRTEPTITDLIQPLALIAIPTALVLIQPDLGTAAVIFFIGLSVVLFAGVGRRVLGLMIAAALVSVPVLVLTGNRLLLDYQKKRIMTFLDPDYDPLGAGYHIIQSQIAIGSGGLLGKGFLHGTQNQLMFLPVKHTDFIFSILAEEWGFIGCVSILALFVSIFLRGLAIAGKARDTFGVVLAFGCTVVLFWHVTINMAMVMGLLPVVGVPLSFLSYGGSSMLASFIAVGVIMNVSIRRFSY